jgi:AbrB family looped-hinge helix DNA binding protein
MTEVSVTQKGQVTIPAHLRRKYGIRGGTKVEVTEEDGRITIKRIVGILDLAGAGADAADPETLKAELDEARRTGRHSRTAP